MDDSAVRVLLVDADPLNIARIRAVLGAQRAPRFLLTTVGSPLEAGDLLREHEYDAILLHLNGCTPPGLPALALLQAEGPGARILVMAPSEDETTALRAVQQGAADYMLTDQLYDTALVRSIRHAQERQREKRRRRDTERALRASERRYRALFEQSRDAIFITDALGAIVDVNAAAAELLGKSVHDLCGERLEALFERPDDGMMLQRELQAKEYAREVEVQVRRADGSMIWCLVSASLRYGPDGDMQGCQAILHDITDRKQAEERLLHEAFHDSLTGLPNRALFTDRLQLAMARWRRNPEQRWAVLFLDLDRFKVVNDSLGHSVGDALLTRVARILDGSMRAQDTVARLGGDEFAVLLEDVVSDDDAVRAAQRIHERLATPFELNGQRLFTSTSIGIAFPSAVEERPDDVLRNADIAMYRAKASGPARFEIFAPSMHTRAIDLMELETDLRLATAHGEFVLHYQPIIDLPDQRIVGFEALIRWNHPRRGLLLPHDFIGIAEETGLIVSIGQWVIHEACRHGRELMDHCPPGAWPIIGVNLSGRQLSVPDLADQIIAILAETGLPPSLLSLEITESSLMPNEAHAVATLHRLREAGVRVCIDDFGTGYSSLAYLHALPVDGLKIDRSFIRRLGSAGDRSELVETILGLAGRLGIATVVEGVETMAQLDHLKRLGPACVQGFLFSRPVDGAAAAALLADAILREAPPVEHVHLLH